MVFQDPYSSFDPLLPVGASVGEPLDVHLGLSAKERSDRLNELVSHVGLAPQHLARYPKELSGGQLQRLAIARALAVDPKLVVLDEPVSSLDVSTQAQVINLLEELQSELGVAFLFIAHNPALVHHASDQIAVMYLGEIVESGPADRRLPDPSAPVHPGTPVRGDRARSRGAAQPQAHRARGRHPGPHRPAYRVPLPHPLSLRHGRVHDRRTDTGGHRGGHHRQLPPAHLVDAVGQRLDAVHESAGPPGSRRLTDLDTNTEEAAPV